MAVYSVVAYSVTAYSVTAYSVTAYSVTAYSVTAYSMTAYSVTAYYSCQSQIKTKTAVRNMELRGATFLLHSLGLAGPTVRRLALCSLVPPLT